jgi:hypothetical protein
MGQSRRDREGCVTTTVIPPEIMATFNAKLLSYPMPGMKEPEHYREYYGKDIEKRYKPGTRKWKEYQMLMEVYEELYEWKKAKEAYAKAEKKEAVERPIVPIEAIHRVRGGLGKMLRESFIVGEQRWAA